MWMETKCQIEVDVMLDRYKRTEPKILDPCPEAEPSVVEEPAEATNAEPKKPLWKRILRKAIITVIRLVVALIIFYFVNKAF